MIKLDTNDYLKIFISVLFIIISMYKTDYQKEYYKKKHKYMDISDSNYTNNLVEKLILEGKIHKNHKILEIGCGKGRFSMSLLKRGYKLTCIDLSRNLLKEFRKNLPKNPKVKIIQGDINKIAPKLEKKFDFIIGFYILHHLQDLKKSFRSMNLMLKKEGKIVFSENNPYNLLYYIQMIITPDMGWAGERGILNMRKGILSPVLSSSGFKDILIKRYGFFPPFISNTRIGYSMEKVLERIKVFYPILPFQIISAKKVK